MEPESNSKSNPWKDRYEHFRVPHETVESWLTDHSKFERVIPIAESQGKTLVCLLVVDAGGELMLDIECK